VADEIENSGMAKVVSRVASRMHGARAWEHQSMNAQVDSISDPLKIAITKRLERDALDELRALVDAGEKDTANVQIDDLERRAMTVMKGYEVTPELIDTVSRSIRIFYLMANCERGLCVAERLRELAEKNGYLQSEKMLPILNAIGICASDVSDFTRAIDALNIGLILAEHLNDKLYQVKMLSSLGVMLMYSGLYAEAVQISERAIRIGTAEPTMSNEIRHCQANVLQSNYLLGNYSEAISNIRLTRFPGVTKSEHETLNRIFFEANSAQVYAETGLLAEAQTHLALSRKYLEACKTSRAVVAFEIAEGVVAVHAGDFMYGLSKMEGALTKARVDRSAWLDYVPLVVRAYERAGQPQEALRHTRALIDQQIALQEKNILRHARLNRYAIDATSGESVIDEAPTVLARLLTRAQILEGQVAKIELMNERQKSFLQRTEMLERMAVMAALRDDASGERVYRIGRLASLLTHMLGEDDHTVFMMEMAARLHDIGKISIPDSVVQKASVYAPAEHDLMKMHTTIGADMLAKSEITELQMAEQIARYHHEHWDGSGYPEGLKGEAIPLPARVVALADVFDALTHARAYRAAFTIDAAIEEINKGRGTQFEPRLVDPFIKLIQLLRREQIADEHGNVPANLDDLLGQSAKASPLLLARQKIWASIDSVTEAKQALLESKAPPESSAEKSLIIEQQKTAKLIETLTPTEREVFKWVQLGKTNPEIAQILGSKTFTIKTHVQRIYGKLGVTGRVGLARLGLG
jgi:putative two-component system response regulator